MLLKLLASPSKKLPLQITLQYVSKATPIISNYPYHPTSDVAYRKYFSAVRFQPAAVL